LPFWFELLTSEKFIGVPVDVYRLSVSENTRVSKVDSEKRAFSVGLKFFL
jgi:hypothetical protein